MNYAIVFAGGVGSRMKSPDLPKQFIEVNGKPIIVYTLEHFQNHKDIKGIIVVCLEQWIPYMLKLVAQFKLCKVLNVVKGGSTGQESIYKGLCALDGVAQQDDIVLLHDGVRPIIDEELISNNIHSVEEFGNAVSVSGATETVCLIDCDGDGTGKTDDHHISKILNRNKCYIGRAPQSFRYSEIMECHKKAIEDNYTTAVDSASMLEHYGHELFFVPCSHFNIKITTPMDLYLFQCYEDAKKRVA